MGDPIEAQAVPCWRTYGQGRVPGLPVVVWVGEVEYRAYAGGGGCGGGDQDGAGAGARGGAGVVACVGAVVEGGLVGGCGGAGGGGAGVAGDEAAAAGGGCRRSGCRGRMRT